MPPWTPPPPPLREPASGRAGIAVFATCELGAAAGLLALCAIVAWHERLRGNAVLLNFVAVFALTAIGASCMAWTGYAQAETVPRGLCLVTAGFASSLAAAKASAAFSLTCKVWSQLMRARHPRSPFIHFANSSLFLISIPWLFWTPLFIVTIVRGYFHPELLERGVYYCETANLQIGLTNLGLAAALEICSLLLAASSTYLVAGSRLRVRDALQTASSDAFHHSLVVRALIFNVAVAGALVVELVLIFTTIPLSKPEWPLFIAAIDVLAFAIIASDPVFLRTAKDVFRACMPRSSRAAPGPQSALSVPIRVAVGAARAGGSGGSGSGLGTGSRASHDSEGETPPASPHTPSGKTRPPDPHTKTPASPGAPRILLPIGVDESEEASLGDAIRLSLVKR